MNKTLIAVLFCLFSLCARAQETNIVPPASIGPISIKQDTESLAALDWANHGQGVTLRFRMDVPKMGGGSEPFFMGAYPYGFATEYAGLWEANVDALSIRKNYRYTHLLPKTHGLGASFYLGDRLDTGGLWVIPVGLLRVDANNQYVINPATNQPYLDDHSVRFMVRTWQNGDGGDLVFGTAGPTRKTIFTGGPGYEFYGSIGPEGLIIGSMNIGEKLAELQARILAIEQALTPVPQQPQH